MTPLNTSRAPEVGLSCFDKLSLNGRNRASSEQIPFALSLLRLRSGQAATSLRPGLSKGERRIFLQLVMLSQSKNILLQSVFNFRHLAWLGSFKKPPRPVTLELGVRRFNAQKEPVTRRQGEARHVKNRMIRHR